MERIVSFQRSRIKVLEKPVKRGIIVDDQMTSDPYRIMKVPHTFHGYTGLIAKAVVNISAFDPRKDARAFDGET